ncbi:MAG: PaaI family thioesterase [Actinophytocola sp.]|uniref:PaaI family thioesterase n=1 Tax=Actinophytocola sp. TaxID=1872138 RepID=UPI003C748F9F
MTEEPLPTFGTVSGLEFQRAVADGAIQTPPFLTLMGVRIRSVAPDGATVCDVTPRPEFTNSGGRLHGGYLTALMDCATATAAHSQQSAGVGTPHIHASYRFLAAADHRGPLVVTARPTHVGRSIVHATAEIHDGRGRLLAAGETIHKVRHIRRTG